jgi:hypothetical protein
VELQEGSGGLEEVVELEAGEVVGAVDEGGDPLAEVLEGGRLDVQLCDHAGGPPVLAGEER